MHGWVRAACVGVVAAAVQPEVIESVAEVVREGASRGLPMAVASGGSRHHVMKGLVSSGLIQYFPEDCIITAEDVKHGKPAPDAFLLAAQRIGVEPNFCVGYEDAVSSQAAYAMSWAAALVQARPSNSAPRPHTQSRTHLYCTPMTAPREMRLSHLQCVWLIPLSCPVLSCPAGAGHAGHP